ncbi:ketopantoate reductase family protein [Dyadobacter sp. CY356]|uniref:ketopantoate reductase family protein n=1 Tax=Dyadobacter sp. CY356 TaxID=2906442 RepID=UPI001F3D78AF|nr:ketopantoate reductase C-terminal domain-containing protein [Dyadobacter sp. CY356]MCF0055376.1 ketopantoate reductase family protein [Dyadobacter sp. CY356]
MEPLIIGEEKDNKNIFIIGNGVIAKALAVALTVNGKNVTILRGTVDNESVYSENIQVETGGEILEAEILISSISNYQKLDGIILLTNKSFGNPALSDKLKSKANHSPIVFLQNGLHIENCFIDQHYSELYRCVLLATSQSLSDNRVRFKLVAPSPVGVIKGSEKTLDNIVETLNTDIFSFRSEADIQNVIWKKVISNCVFNSICPLLETDNGVFLRNEAVLQIAKTVISECLAVARENGIDLTQEEVLQNVLSISKMSDGQKISTYQDILNKRETEIDTLNFAIAKAAALTNQLEVPVTALLGELIKIMSELSRI